MRSGKPGLIFLGGISMNIKAAVFDLDHTLFDRYATIRAIKNTVFDNLKGYVKDGLTADGFAEILIALDKKYIIYEWDEVIKQLKICGALKEIPEDFYNLAIRPGFIKTAVPYPFTIPALRKIKEMSVKCGLITNGTSDIQRSKVKMLGLEELMDEIVVGGEVGKNKPDPEPLKVFAEKIGFEPKNMLYIGDNPFNDVEGSRNAGYIPVWVKTYGTWDDSVKKADFEVNNVGEIPALISKLI